MNISVGKTRIDLVEPFRRAVERSIWEGGEVGIQVAAYSDSKLVVDIWAGIADPTTGREVQADTLRRTVTPCALPFRPTLARAPQLAEAARYQL
jgi:hypothetical protein